MEATIYKYHIYRQNRINGNLEPVDQIEAKNKPEAWEKFKQSLVFIRRNKGNEYIFIETSNLRVFKAE